MTGVSPRAKRHSSRTSSKRPLANLERRSPDLRSRARDKSQAPGSSKTRAAEPHALVLTAGERARISALVATSEIDGGRNRTGRRCEAEQLIDGHGERIADFDPSP